MPLVRHIYNASKQISAAISPDQNTQAFKEVAIIRHPRIGEYAFGFITSSVVLQIKFLKKLSQAHFAAEGARIASAAMANAISDATSVIAHGWFTTCRDILDVLGEGHHLHQPADPVEPARGARVRGGWAPTSQHSQYEVGSYSGVGPFSASAPFSAPTIWSLNTRRRMGR
ncbi:hypothetical protein HS088_TW23G00731 [Tripterygium wilfordii]|uniref:Uncharacterized protein n=1 Tax=Tripterygium wilfordii TaxID=458696 RepID=A0A7J7BVW6_TRIWF|nr:hypothetical protein HS088_TW23G00731 [Tripterygium wilfordii]